MTSRRARRPPRRHGGTFLAAVVVALSALIGAAGPAAAVTPRPTDYRSSVQSVEPSAPITVRVIGGDTLLDLRAEPGHEVVVQGYGGEPYLRVQPDGTTQVNQRSPAVSLNRTRDATISGSDGGSVTDPPDWQTLGHDGRLIWHDHRIHAQDTAEFSGDVAWAVPVSVDGAPVTIEGRLERIDPPSPLPFLGLAVLVAGATWLLGRKRPRVVAAITLAAASVVAASTGGVEWATLPSSVARNAGLFLLPMAAGAAAVLGLVIRRRTPAMVALLASASLLSGWLAFRWSILTRSVLVSDLAPTLDRVALAAVLGGVVAAAGLTVQWAGTPEIREPGADGLRPGPDRPSAPARPGPSPRAAG